MPGHDEEYEEFARARTPVLLRSAWLLCGDAHLAEDLVQETLAKVYVRWHAAFRSPIENPVAYAQTTLTRTFLSSRRRRSSTERPTGTLPERPVDDGTDRAATRLALLAALDGLAPKDRTVLVLRYLEDLSVEETADRMGCSPGAVRSRSLRALDRIRPLLGSSFSADTERHPS
ncbi:SigE family RNA polymerase sigma factor [Nocardioides litoris]|uniref:SigE family RNA polymerase sigma factor n=1 Tax=Nocardioides litoris TaxID=1926648 RepID=UPI001123E440|nr:SigE family RNA polymerase sigma factor [Nocardioides litoris]